MKRPKTKKKLVTFLNTVSAKGFKTPKKRNDTLLYAKNRYNIVKSIKKTRKKSKNGYSYGFKFIVIH